MEEIQKDLIRLCKGYPEGLSLLEINGLYQRTYGKPLCIGTTKRLQTLLRSMPEHLHLCTNDGMVVWPAASRPSSSSHPSSSSLDPPLPSPPAALAAAARQAPHLASPRSVPASGKEIVKNMNKSDMKKSLAKIVALIHNFPYGVPVNKVAEHYNKKYGKCLTLAFLGSLGFRSMAHLLSSLANRNLVVVEGDLVFHQSHCPPGGARGQRPRTPEAQDADQSDPQEAASPVVDSQPAKARKKRDRSERGASPAPTTGLPLAFGVSPAPPDVPAATARHTEKLPQDQLLQRIRQGPSMEAAPPRRPVRTQKCEAPTPLSTMANPKDSKESPWGEPKQNPLPSISQPSVSLPSVSRPSGPSDEDFPSLAEARDPRRTTPTRQRAERAERGERAERAERAEWPEERRNTPVFTDSYYAQLRRVNGANMRAVDALEEDNEDAKGRRRHRAPDAETINILAEGVIRDLAAEGELVTQEKVVSKMCILMQAPSLKSVGILQAWHIPAVKELQYIVREINMFLESTVAATSICTLYELGQSLAGLKDKKRYEELNLGPLCKLSIVHRMFKIDSNTKDDEIPQIETVDILKSLRLFRRQYSKQKVDLAEFMKYLADQHSCDSPYELGIRIHSVGLPIATLAKVTRNEHLYLEHAQDLIQQEMEEEVQERMRKVKRSVMEPFSSSSTGAGSLALRKKYVSMAAAEVVLEVFTHAGEIFGAKANKCVQAFLLQVGGDRLSTAMFQLAICGGSLAVPQDLVARKQPANAAAKPATHEPAVALPSEGAVKQFLKESLSNQNTLTLAHMASLEKKLSKHFKLPEFGSLQKGTFLDFLVKHVQLLQETVGGAIALGGGGAELQGCGFRPSRQDVFEFMKQCGPFTSTEPDTLVHIEWALRSHYRLRDSRDLGFGPLRTLADLVKRQRDMLGGGGCVQVHYETALFAKHSSGVDVGEASVGLLGEVTREQAMASLLSCPLLEDLEKWSQWEAVFKPLHGPLKEFIERNAELPANSELAALEVCPGVLLRITTVTGDKLFSRAAMALDPVGTAGHLVSMAVAEGVANVSKALLANHMESALAEGVVNADKSPSEDDDARVRTVARYLLESLTLIPPTTCLALLQQVFLEPLYRVLGQASSKTLLLTTARSDPRHLNRLHHIAIRLGFTDWIADYQKSKLHRPQPRDALPATGAHSKYDLVDSASGSLSALHLDGGEDDDDDDLEELTKDDGSETSSLSRFEAPKSCSAESEREDDEEEEEEEEEEEAMYELVDRETPSGPLTASESDGGQETCKADPSDPGDVAGEEGDAADGDAETSQRALIEDIRKSQFGVGVELTAECKKLMVVHQDRLGRSLDRLSTELYSKDAHFVLELIQNADDNSYRTEEGEALPALALVVERDCVTVLNNETGFQEHNIRAICDVGRSTKGKHKYGYIGQKGIGFKSVFKVTDRPEIHSNGFHLRFDKTSGPMGYILPHWVEDERPLDLPQIPGTTQNSWTTKICLPLRSENQQTRNLFHDVHPSLLLFLHRLRSITIDNQCPLQRQVVSMTRRDRSHNVLEVEHRSHNAQEAEPTVETERWLVIKRMLEPKKIKEEVESTELALAFLLADGDIMALPQKQPVFAFLPLRSFGFRFIVQGDFDIPSSREDVDRDSSWNQFLRSEIPQLFVHALDIFNDHPDFSGMKGLVHFLQFVPLPDEVLDFFKPVAKQIIQLLKGKAFLPTLNSEREVEYKLPSQVAVCQDTVIRNVIGREELDRHLSLAYLHPRLQPLPSASLLTHLGVRHLMGADVTTVTTAMARELIQGGELHTDKGLRRLARLLVCNFRALENGYGEAEPILGALRELPIIPLADGRVVALSGTGVFFPMEKAETTTKKKGKQNPAAGPFAALYEDVSVVLPALLACEQPLEAQQVRELLRRLGVHTMEPQQLLEQHIYPTLRHHTWKDKPERVVVSYLVYIKQYGSASTLSDTTVPVLTSRGLLCPQLNRVHFSVEYNNVDLPHKLPGCDWLLLSSCYVETDGDVEGWRDFFWALGVRDLLIIRKARRTLDASQLASSPWAGESSSWPQGPAEGDYVVDDYPCEEFHSLATAQLPDGQLLEQRRALLELLETNWCTGERYSQYIAAHVIAGGDGDGDEGRQAKSVRSSFFHSLSRLPWLPAYRLLEGGGRQVQYLRPDATYLASPQVHDLLGMHVCYVEARPSELSQALGMRLSISVEEMISYLKTWSVREEEDPDSAPQAREFTSTMQHIYNVYSYLQKNCSQVALKELFQHTPAVFVEHQRREEGWSAGRFYHLREVCWNDPTGMFLRYRSLVGAPDSTLQAPRVLAPFYASLDGMKELFTKYLNVEASPTMYQYVGLLELVCSSCPMPTAEVLQDVSVIYARLALKCKTTTSADQEYMDPASQPQTNPSYCSSLKGMVSDKRVFPTKDKSWVTLARRPMIADDKALEKIFRPHPRVCLLNLPPADKKHTQARPAFSEEDRALFLEICGVRLLSSCVRTEPQTENLRACPTMQALVRAVVPYIQRFLCHQEELVLVYQELLDADIGQKVRRLQYRQVGRLYIRYELSVGGNEDSEQDGPLVELEDVVCLLMDDKELYIQKDHLSAKLDICRELAKLFCTEAGHRKELVDFLNGLMTSLDDPLSLKRFLRKEALEELPSEEEPWEVPEPPRPELPHGGAPSREAAPFATPEEAPRRRDEDGEQTLACWPPRAPMGSAGMLGRTGARTDGDAVDAVMKMWPAPAPPKDREPDKPSSSGTSPGVPSIADHGAAGQPLSGQPRPTAMDHTHPGSPSGHQPPEGGRGQRQGPSASGPAAGPSGGERGPESPSPEHSKTDSDRPPAAHLIVPVVVSGVFQGTEGIARRPPLAMDFPQLNKDLALTLEDMDLACVRPTTVVLKDDAPGDLEAIGAWGEQLVNSFLCHWRDGEAASRPSEVSWCNQRAESGQPYDFELTFADRQVYVEVKSTVKRDKAFIRLSANELDFALKERERYHIFRVYSVGDAHNVRLCRIRNLAQTLHAKELELFLFV